MKPENIEISDSDSLLESIEKLMGKYGTVDKYHIPSKMVEEEKNLAHAAKGKILHYADEVKKLSDGVAVEIIKQLQKTKPTLGGESKIVLKGYKNVENQNEGM